MGLLLVGPVAAALLLWGAESAQGAVGVFAGVSAVALLLLAFDRRGDEPDAGPSASETQTRAILETAPDGIVTADGQGRIYSANRAAAKIFEMKRDEIVGAMLRELVPSIAAAENQSGDNTTAILLTRGVEHTGRRANGDEFPLEVNMGFLPSGVGEAGMVLIFRDIAGRKRVERELRAARDRALDASEAKSQFLANMSHELRTPLNGVIGYADMLREEIHLAREEGRGIKPKQFLADLGRITGSGKHLLGIVEDILRLSTIESGDAELDIETFDICELVDEIAERLQARADDSGNDFRVDCDASVGQMRSDRDKVRQILRNLLTNAFKFTHDGRVELRVCRQPHPQHGEMVVFEIADTGIGMSQGQLDTIFEAFNQADNSSTRRFGGTGLGLTITHDFCRLLDGGIDVESTVDRGSTFTVRLPADLGAKSDSSKMREGTLGVG
ncbi:MAG: PAS domain-containing sensor histidine kinase [Persicimonas sp.]